MFLFQYCIYNLSATSIQPVMQTRNIVQSSWTPTSPQNLSNMKIILFLPIIPTFLSGLLIGLLGSILNSFQFILHTMARLIFSKHKSEQFTQLLGAPQWILTALATKNKIFIISREALHDITLFYLASLILHDTLTLWLYTSPKSFFLN